MSGVLSVHHYPSRYQNWDFVDDIKHNPCVERAEGKNLALSSYPISIRALNFTLPQWIDGRDWSFFADQVPSDFLSCDAWMIHQPTGYLWHLATHTNGYERVPNILRRRHTMSVCLAVEAYNSASESYRSRVCPTGFNHNRRIPMEFHKKAWSTAVALADGTTMEEEPPVYFGDYKRKKGPNAVPESDLKPGQEGSDELHFVFTTSCEPYQDWQSEALAQSFARVGQRGALTRIVSGCSDDAVKELLRRTQKSSPHLRIHVTRDFRSLPIFKEVSDDVEKASTPDDYAPYNKPFGLRDWLESANPPVREELVVVLDPDFLFIRPFAVNTGGRVTSAKGWTRATTSKTPRLSKACGSTSAFSCTRARATRRKSPIRWLPAWLWLSAGRNTWALQPLRTAARFARSARRCRRPTRPSISRWVLRTPSPARTWPS